MELLKVYSCWNVVHLAFNTIQKLLPDRTMLRISSTAL
jgi:hypothetical protein